MTSEWNKLTAMDYFNESNDCFRKMMIYDYEYDAFSYDWRDLYQMVKGKTPDVWKECEEADYYEKTAKEERLPHPNDIDPLWIYCRGYQSPKAVCEYICFLIEEDMDGTVCGLQGCPHCGSMEEE